MMKNNIVDELSASYYSFKQIDQSRSYNQFANLKIVGNYIQLDPKDTIFSEKIFI